MEIIKKINKEIAFDHNISEITSVCMDIDYEFKESTILGSLNLEGDYVSSEEISINETFNHKIDFNIPLDDRIVADSLKVAIDDFTYDIDQDKLIINVELKINYENEVSEERIEFDKFLDEQEINIDEIVDNIKTDENEFDSFDISKEEVREEKEEINENNDREYIDESKMLEDNLLEITNSIEDDEEYITYHIYIVNENDTLETISNRYHVSIESIKEYNEIENIKSGMKLVIPCENE